jgi:hypothetical protein
MKYVAHQSTLEPRAITGREWRSELQVAGFPLIHIAFGRDANHRILMAQGVIAIGQYAAGGICISQFGIGVVCLSQFSVAGVSVAQFAIAGYALAQFGIVIDGIAQFALRAVNLFPA